MDRSKTRIWREGLAGLTRGGEPAESSDESAPPAWRPKFNPLKARGGPPPPPPPTAARMPFLQTRIMPIERLLPGHPVVGAPRPPASVLVTPVVKTAPAVPSAPAPGRKRYVGQVLMGLATLLAVTAWHLWGILRAPASRSVAPVHAEPLAPASGSLEPVPAAPPAALAEMKPARAPKLQREAVDAVAAGDYARARAAYEALARSDPESEVYRAATRVLDARELARRATQQR